MDPLDPLGPPGGLAPGHLELVGHFGLLGSDARPAAVDCPSRGVYTVSMRGIPFTNQANCNAPKIQSYGLKFDDGIMLYQIFASIIVLKVQNKNTV